MKKAKHLTGIFLACLLLSLCSCTSLEDTLSDLQIASSVMEEFEKLQMTQFNVEYLSNLLEFYTDGFPLLSDRFIALNMNKTLSEIAENMNDLQKSKEKMGVIQEGIRLMHAPGIDESSLNEIFEKYEYMLSSLKENFSTLKQYGKKTDTQQFSGYFLSSDYKLERTCDLSNLYYDACIQYLENFKGSFQNKRMVNDFKDGARLSSFLYQLTNLAIDMHDSLYDHYIELSYDAATTSEHTNHFTEKYRKQLDSLSQKLEDFSASAAEIQNTAAKINLDFSELNGTIVALKKNLEEICHLNDDMMKYEKTRDSEIYLNAIDTVSELDAAIAENIRKCSDYNWSVKTFLGCYSL